MKNGVKSGKFFRAFIFTAAVLFSLSAAAAPAQAFIKDDWPKKVNDDFLMECAELSAMAGITGEKKDVDCQCALKKVKAAYPNPNLYDAGALPNGFVPKMLKECQQERKKK